MMYHHLTYQRCWFSIAMLNYQRVSHWCWCLLVPTFVLQQHAWPVEVKELEMQKREFLVSCLPGMKASGRECAEWLGPWGQREVKHLVKPLEKLKVSAVWILLRAGPTATSAFLHFARFCYVWGFFLGAHTWLLCACSLYPPCLTV